MRQTGEVLSYLRTSGRLAEIPAFQLEQAASGEEEKGVRWAEKSSIQLMVWDVVVRRARQMVRTIVPQGGHAVRLKCRWEA